MNRIVSFILLLLFASYAMGNVMVLANYHINNAAYISQCENKNKAWLHCNGQCQLKKQMDKNDGENQSSKKSQSSETLVFFITSAENDSKFVINLIATFSDKNQCNTISQPRSHFHPPNQLSILV